MNFPSCPTDYNPAVLRVKIYLYHRETWAPSGADMEIWMKKQILSSKQPILREYRRKISYFLIPTLNCLWDMHTCPWRLPSKDTEGCSVNSATFLQIPSLHANPWWNPGSGGVNGECWTWLPFKGKPPQPLSSGYTHAPTCTHLCLNPSLSQLAFLKDPESSHLFFDLIR